MIKKRNTLKKLAGVGAVVSLAPSSWTKPIVGSVILPAHAQTSPNQAPTISGISCTSDTPILQVGSVITMEASIADVDNALSDIGWGILNSNSGLIVTGEGQFVTTTYTVVDGDVGTLQLELEVFDGTGNRSTEILCDDSVIDAPQPIVTATVSGTPTFSEEITDTSATIIGDVANFNGSSLDVILSVQNGTVTQSQFSTTLLVDLLQVTNILNESGQVVGQYTVDITWLSADTVAPVGQDATVSASNFTSASGSVVVSDDVDSSPSIILLTTGDHGSLSFTGSDFEYTGTESGYFGSDTATYKVVDNAGNESITYTITINDIFVP